MNRRNPNNFPELAEPTFFILLSLYHNANYGYGILKDVEELTDGIVVLKSATLYKALERLVSNKYVTVCDESQQRYYKITELGYDYFSYHYKRTKWRLKIADKRMFEKI